MPKKYHMILDDPEYIDHAVALGRMLGHWGILETQLIRMTEFLLGVNHHKADFVYKEFVSIQSKITLLRRLNRWFINDIPLRTEINKLLLLAKNLNSERNKFVHAFWRSRASYENPSDKLMRISLASPGSKLNQLYKKPRRLTPKDIQDFGGEIAKLSQSFEELLSRVLPTSSI